MVQYVQEVVLGKRDGERAAAAASRVYLMLSSISFLFFYLPPKSPPILYWVILSHSIFLRVIGRARLKALKVVLPMVP
jgi:hypothetical protein